MKKKYLSMFLSLTVMSALFPVSACAEAAPEYFEEDTEAVLEAEYDFGVVPPEDGEEVYDEAHVSITSFTYPCYIYDMEDPFDLPLYFIGGAEDLPYVNLTDWIDIMATSATFLNDDENYMIYLEKDGHVAQLSRDNTYSMLVDFKEGTISFDDYDAFIHSSQDTYLLDVVKVGSNDEEGSELLLSRNEKGSFDRYGKEIELNLTDYDIPLYWSEDDDLYLLPLQTMGDFLLAPPYLVDVLFNEEAVYIAGIDQLYDGDEVTELGESFFQAPYKEMSPQLAYFSYCELCLVMDHMYGLSDLHGINGFDRFFTETGYRELLTSTDPSVADGALNDFLRYYLDDGHSGMEAYSYRTSQDRSMEGSGVSSRLSLQDAEYFESARNAADHEIGTYEEVGNTAYITFDSFDILHTPEEYYDGDVDVPSDPSEDPLDTVALIIYAHEQITRVGSPIENIVLDLSLNTGGAIDAAAITASWFLGETNLSIQSSFTGASSTGLYRADINLDGQFDEKDSVADKNLYCLISPVSFSCGNLVPNILKSSHRVTILGQTSGGGSCSVQPLTTAYGSCYNISSPLTMSYVKNGSFYDIDNGIEPDFFIAKPSHFYDRSALTDYINQLF